MLVLMLQALLFPYFSLGLGLFLVTSLPVELYPSINREINVCFNWIGSRISFIYHAHTSFCFSIHHGFLIWCGYFWNNTYFKRKDYYWSKRSTSFIRNYRRVCL